MYSKLRFIALFTFYLMSSWSASATWYYTVEDDSDGTQCILSAWSANQEPTSIKRERSVVNLTVLSFEPFVARFELISGIKSSLKTVGALKINDEAFSLKFDDEKGTLFDLAEHEMLIKALRAGSGMLVGYRNAQKDFFDTFNIGGLDDKIKELHAVCAMSS